MFENECKEIENKLFKPNNKQKEQNQHKSTTKTSNINRNMFYFETLTDNEFFDVSGIKPEFFEFYKKIIKSGVGTVVLGGVYLGLNFKTINNIARLSIEENIMSKYKQVNKLAHTSNCKTFLKVKSCYGRFNELYNQCSKTKLASNFGIDDENQQKILIRISDNKCNEIVADFAQKVMLSTIAGFDGIMIDASLSNVIGELTSPEFNKRIFGYYSDTSDLVEKMLTNAKSKNNTIILKLTLFTFFQNDKKNANLCQNFQNINQKQLFNMLIKFIKLGVDGFEFVFGTNENEFLSKFNSFEDELLFAEIITKIRKFFTENEIKNKFGEDVIIFYHDNFTDINKAVKLIENNIVNLIDITRNIYTDKHFLKNLINKKSYLNCIKCSYCDKKSHFNSNNECLINPSLTDFGEMISDGNNRPVAVIGSGISGLICSLTLAKRGFVVHLFEKHNELNHVGKLTTIFGFDNLLLNYFNKIEDDIKLLADKKRIVLHIGENFDIANYNLKDFHSIILATGFKTKFLSITGAVQAHVHSIYEVLSNNEILSTKKHIVIYAKSELSLKLALYLLTSNNYKNITIIIKDNSWLKYSKNANLFYFFWILLHNNVSVHFLSQIIKINEDNLDLQIRKNFNSKSIHTFLNIMSNGKISNDLVQINIDCDLLVYEPDIIPNNKLFAEIVNSNYRGEVYMIGNALENCELADIIKSGYFVGKNL